jgi:hypothetical protein
MCIVKSEIYHIQPYKPNSQDLTSAEKLFGIANAKIKNHENCNSILPWTGVSGF